MFTSWCVHCRYCCIHDCTCYMCYNVNEYMLMCWCVDACMLRCSKFLNFQDNYTVYCTVYCTSKNSFFAISESTKKFSSLFFKLKFYSCELPYKVVSLFNLLCWEQIRRSNCNWLFISMIVMCMLDRPFKGTWAISGPV